MRLLRVSLLVVLSAPAYSCGEENRPAEPPAPVANPTSSASQRVSTTDLPGTSNAGFGLPLGSLPPDVQASLEKIKVLKLTDSLLDLVWSLKDNAMNYDVLVLDCAPQNLSTSRVNAIVDWAKSGHGLFIQGRHADLFASHFIPPPGQLRLSGFPGQLVLAREGAMVQEVSVVSHLMWCSVPGGFQISSNVGALSTDLSASISPGLSPDQLFVQNQGSLHPIYVDPGGVNSYALFGSTFQGARTVWYAGDIDFSRRDCKPEFDDARLWSNVMHWLAGFKSGETRH